jgi:GNAT superfamily N-acetyltransferase
MKVRRATETDLPVAEALLRQLDEEQREWRVFRPRPSFAEQVLARYRQELDDERAVFLVAEEEEGEVVGMAHAAVHVPSSASDERALELSGVVVRRDHRGRGVGRALVAEAVRFAREMGVRWVTLKVFARNEGARAFWESLGFSSRMVQLTADSATVLGRAAEHPDPNAE